MMSKILWLLLVLLLPGCEVGEGNTNEEKVKSARVELLFEHEGCRVYYARPKGLNYFVYTNCAGSTHWETTNTSDKNVRVNKHSVTTSNINCVDVQVSNFNELCSNSTTPYEEMSGADAFQQGVKCAVDSIKKCEGGL